MDSADNFVRASYLMLGDARSHFRLINASYITFKLLDLPKANITTYGGSWHASFSLDIGRLMIGHPFLKFDYMEGGERLQCLLLVRMVLLPSARQWMEQRSR